MNPNRQAEREREITCNGFWEGRHVEQGWIVLVKRKKDEFHGAIMVNNT